MDTRNVAVGKVALTLAILSISYTALGADNTVKRDHEQSTETTSPASTAGTSGTITQPSSTASAADREKLRLFQVKAFIASTAQALPDEQKQKLLSALATKPQNQAQADAQKQLAKDVVDKLPKELLSDQDRQQLNASFATLAANGATPATAEELRKAAEDLLKPPAADAAKGAPTAQAAAAAAAPNNLGGATSDPSKVAKGDDKAAGTGDPKADAINALKSQIGDLKKQLEANRNNAALDPAQNAALNKALENLNKGNENQGNNSGNNSGSPSSSPSDSGQSSPSKSADSSDSKQPDHNSAKNENKNEKKDLPPLFADSKGDSKDNKNQNNDNNQNKTPEEDDKPLVDVSKLKAESEKAKEEAAKAAETAKKASEQPDASAFGGGDVADIGGPGGPGDGLPPGNSQVGQSISGGGGSFDPSGGNFDFGGGGGDSGGGGLGSAPVAGSPGSSGGAGGEFPNGVGNDMGGGYPGPIKYAYDKGQGVYKGGGGGDTGGADGDGEMVDAGPEYAQASATDNPALRKRFATVESQVLIAPNRNGALAKRPGPFAYTEVAYTFVDKKSKKGSTVKVKSSAPPEDQLALGNENLISPAAVY